MPIKRIYLTRRNPAIPAEEFPREWRRHAALAASFSRVNNRYTRVAQCTRFDAEGALPANDFAGVALLWMRSLEIALEVNHDPEVIQRLRPDEVRVFGMEVVHCAMFAQESVLRDEGCPVATVLIEFLRRAPGSTREDFARAWEAYGRAMVAGGLPGADVARYTHNLVVGTPPPGYEFDGVAETWFDSEQAALRHVAPGGAWAQAVGRRAGFCQEEATVAMPTRVTHAWSAPA